MITLETIVGAALQNSVVMDHLGEALRSDLVLANPYYRRLVEFADDFLVQRRRLPGDTDWEAWLTSLDSGMIQDGTREALGRLLAHSVGEYDPQFFAEQVIKQLQQAAARIALARLNEVAVAGSVEPEAFALLAEKVAAVQAGGLTGLARLDDLNVWFHPVREDELVGTGYPTLNRLIGGWGKELWMVFADSGMGKSMLLQNFASAAAVRGKRVLHITLELGIRSQIHRYYRQIAGVSRAEFVHNADKVRRDLGQWFRLAQGEIFLLEFPAYGLDPDTLRRTIERANRVVGDIDLLVLDYLDLLTLKTRGRGGAYEDLGRLTHETRSLCSEFDLTALTASQAVRRPEHAGRLTQRDMGDSYHKVRGADGLLSLVQTPEEEEVHQGRLGILKVRDSGGRGIEVPLYINRELAVIAELSHPNTVELMKRLGHLPDQIRPTGGGLSAE